MGKKRKQRARAKRIQPPKEIIRDFKSLIWISLIVVFIGLIVLHIECFVPGDRYSRLHEVETTVDRVEKREVYESGYSRFYPVDKYFIITEEGEEYIIPHFDDIDEIYRELTKGTAAKIKYETGFFFNPAQEVIANGKTVVEYNTALNRVNVAFGIIIIVIGALILTPLIVVLIINEIKRRKREAKKRNVKRTKRTPETQCH